MKPVIADYTKTDITPSSTLRTIILFGRNVSTYKFALANVLLGSKAQSSFKYEELRDDFLKELYAHYLKNPNQYQGGSNSLTSAFDKYSKDSDWEKLVPITERNIYNNVFDAFHNVGGSTIKEEFKLFEHDKESRRLVMTDNFIKIVENTNLSDQIAKENQSRWNIVEEAWKNKLSPNMLIYETDQNVYSVTQDNERVNLRSAVDILLPYQQGRCFYCNKKLNPESESIEHDFPDVDHLIPHSAFSKHFDLMNINSNGMWNLVIACQECNRGASGKFDQPPEVRYYDKLISRNILFTQEHKHSLKNTILLSIGANTPTEVRNKMQLFNSYFKLLIGWKPKIMYEND